MSIAPSRRARFLGLAALFAALPLTLIASPAGAQTAPGSGPGTVEVALLLRNDHALADWLSRSHPDVAAARARVAQQQAAVGVARRLLPNPSLGFTVGGIALGERNPASLSPGDTMNYTVGLYQTIELGKRGPRVDAEVLRRDATEQAFRDTLAGRLADARDALARVIYFDARQKVLDERLKSAQDIATLEKTRLQQGDISGIDHDRLVLDAMQVEREVADNHADAQLALADCAASLVVARCSSQGATMDAVDAAAPAPMTLPDVAPAIAGRPDVRALRFAGQAADADATGWRRQAIPDPTVGVAYTRDFLTYAGDQPSTLSLTLSIPLPIFDHGAYQARQASGQATELELQARSLESRARADADALLTRRRILEQKLKELQEGAVPHSRAVLQAMQTAYQHGQVSMTDLLLVRRDDVALTLDVTDTRFALFAIRNQLRRVLGLDAAELSGGSRGDR